MYICHFCKQPSQSGDKLNKIVIETREKEYEERTYKIGNKKIEDPGGVGREIVKEVGCCKICCDERIG